MNPLAIWTSTAVLFAVLMMAGCATERITDEVPKGVTSEQKAVAETQEAIAQATRGLLSAQQILLDEIESGVFTRDELLLVQAKLKQVRTAIEAANSALKGNDVLGALAKARDANALSASLEKFLESDLARRRRNR